MSEPGNRALSIVKDLIEHCKREYWEFYEALDVLMPKKSVKKKAGDNTSVLSGGFYQDNDRGVFSTDGKYLLYDEELVNIHYKDNQFKTLPHLLMHVILHLIMNDLETYRNTANKKLFSAYADIRVEDILYNMEKRSDEDKDGCILLAGFEIWKYRIRSFKNLIPSLPESYFAMAKDPRIRKEVLKADIVYCDHSFWERRASLSDKRKWESIRTDILSGGNDGKKAGEALFFRADKKSNRDKDIYRALLNIAKDHGEDMTDCFLYGDEGGRVKQRGRAAKENNNSYIDVLRDFTNVKERSMEDPESIDRNMYEYGLEMYGNVALIEPLEDKEIKCFDTIAVAIDTSGSCAGDVVSSFLRETANLFRDISYNDSGGKVILYQCDSCIQKKELIEDLERMEDKFDAVDLFGFGGTSFVPVFDDLKKYEAEGTGKVDALFYLTDGFGDYPDEAPGYKTFFIIPDKEDDIPDEYIPDWIERLKIDI